jgi:hypothetical protein
VPHASPGCPGALEDLAFVIPFAALLLLWISIWLVVPLLIARNKLARQSWLGEPVTFVFGPETVQIASASVSSEIHWSVVREVRETRSLFLLYYGAQSAAMIPKRFFASAAGIQAWKELIQARIKCSPIAVRGMAARCC